VPTMPPPSAWLSGSVVGTLGRSLPKRKSGRSAQLRLAAELSDYAIYLMERDIYHLNLGVGRDQNCVAS
jgi:hypothetical protein